MAYYLRTKEVYDIEEETGKAIEDFLDADCFDEDESDNFDDSGDDEDE